MTARSQLAGMALVAVFCASSAYSANADAPPTGNVREATLAEYRQHLVELNAVVAACAKARDTKSCDPALAGADDRVPISNAPNAERRLVRYNWLRALLAVAQEKDKTQEKAQDKASPPNENHGNTPTKPADGTGQPPADETTRAPKPTTSQLLQAAETRLTKDILQADAMAAASPAPAADYTRERGTMKQVLAGRDFRNLETSTVRDTLLEKLGEWLNRLWESAAGLQARAAWVGRVIIWGFILAVCVGLAWGLLQMERRWRIRLVPESTGPAAGAASARDWQLRDGRNLAARQAMLLGAMLAGQAFANAPCAAVHALAYPIGGIFHVPHGLSNSLVLPHVLRVNASHAAPLYAELAEIVAPEALGSDEARTQGLIEGMEQLALEVGIETRLRQVGIAETDLDRLADDAMLQTRLLTNNPRELTRDEVRAIYAAAL